MGVKKIMIADDEARMRKLVGDFLKREGYCIVEAEDGKRALELFKDEYDGWAVCREIRKTSNIPVIMLTARGEEFDELFAFELGADEYVTKPFRPQILVARVQAVLRRTENDNRPVIAYNGLVFDESGRHVQIDGQCVDMSPKEFELLSYLIKNEGRALSRDQILNAVWDYNYFGDVRTVDTHIKQLRTKLRDKGQFIQTVRGVGYRFEVKK
jgi:DNA-binding response OmpR family regulator